MREVVKSIHQLIYNQEYKEAEKLLKSYIDTKKLSSAQYIEDVFTIHLHTVPIIRHFLKYLDISKVPPSPIDTQFDEGRRFFYTLYILNRTGGMRLVGPYLENIITHRPLEKRFLAGIFFLQLNYEKAASIYRESAEMIKDDTFSEVEHSLIYGNLGACFLYLEDYDSYEKTKQLSLGRSNNHEAIRRIYSKYDILKFAQMADKKQSTQAINLAKENGFIKKIIRPKESNFFESILAIINNDQKEINSNLEQIKDWFANEIKNGIRTPERYIAVMNYLKKIANNFAVNNDYFNSVEKINYPIHSFKVLGETFDDSNFLEMGDSTKQNYINYDTEEFYINGNKGIGLNNEIKAIYFIARSEGMGITFETLASLIYDHSDYAGLFLVKERMKQIIHRLRGRYKIDLRAKFYRAYMNQEDIRNIHIQKKGRMKIRNGFSLIDFENFYQVSTSKAKKMLKLLLDKKILQKEIVGKKNIYKFNK